MNNKPLQVLVVEDNEADFRLVQEFLGEADSGVTFEVQHASDLQESLAVPGMDVCLLDLNLPDSKGLETLGAMIKKGPVVPIVVLTGALERRLGVQAVKMGAQDFLRKGAFDADGLARSLQYAVVRSQLFDSVQRFREASAKEARARESLELMRWIINKTAHELRTPLAPIAIQMDLMQRRLAERPDAELGQLLAVAQRNLRRLRDQVEIFILEADWEMHGLVGKPETVDIQQLLKDITSEEANIIVEGPATAILGSGHRKPLHWALRALVQFALRTSNGGRVKVKVEKEEAITVEIRGPMRNVTAEAIAGLQAPFGDPAHPLPDVGGDLSLRLHAARRVARHHGGELAYEQTSDGGVLRCTLVAAQGRR